MKIRGSLTVKYTLAYGENNLILGMIKPTKHIVVVAKTSKSSMKKKDQSKIILLCSKKRTIESN